MTQAAILGDNTLQHNFAWLTAHSSAHKKKKDEEWVAVPAKNICGVMTLTLHTTRIKLVGSDQHCCTALESGGLLPLL
jgi:hypothetical protein